MMQLAERRAVIAAEHAAMEKYDPFWKQEAKEGRPIASRPIAFLCDDEVVFLQQDAGAIHAALSRFAGSVNGVLTDRAKHEPAVAHAIAKAKQMAERAPPDELRIPQQVWNAYALALAEVGVTVVMADGVY